MSSLGKYPDLNINVIAKSMESYSSFSIDSMRFLDSYQFLSTSLECLVENQAAEEDLHTSNNSENISPTTKSLNCYYKNENILTNTLLMVKFSNRPVFHLNVNFIVD